MAVEESIAKRWPEFVQPLINFRYRVQDGAARIRRFVRDDLGFGEPEDDDSVMAYHRTHCVPGQMQSVDMPHFRAPDQQCPTCPLDLTD